jgi:hypothetical protein
MTFSNIHNRTQLAYTGKDDDDADNDEITEKTINCYGKIHTRNVSLCDTL